MKRTRLIYLAQPYSHRDPFIVRQRVLFGAYVAGKILTTLPDTMVYAPIAHGQTLADVSNLPIEWEFWREMDFAMIDRCDELWVLTIEGWKESVGVDAEMAYARELGIPVHYIDEGLADLGQMALKG